MMRTHGRREGNNAYLRGLTSGWGGGRKALEKIANAWWASYLGDGLIDVAKHHGPRLPM